VPNRILTVLFAITSLYGVMASEPSSKNLVSNPHFDQNLEGWQASFPEANETKYARNSEWITITTVGDDKSKISDDDPADPQDKIVTFTLSKQVAASEGVKLVSDLMPVDPTYSYRFGADVQTHGPKPIIFLEGYQVDSERKESGSDQIPGYVRVWRATIHVKEGKGLWQRATRVINFPKQERFRPAFIRIKLYAYHPAGEVSFDNVFLCQEKTSSQHDADAKRSVSGE